MQEVGRWTFGDYRAAREFLDDEAGGVKLSQRFDLARIPAGKGWRITEDAGGLIAIELTAEECDAYIERMVLGEAKVAEIEQQEEDRRREAARFSREMASPSPRAPR